MAAAAAEVGPEDYVLHVSKQDGGSAKLLTRKTRCAIVGVGMLLVCAVLALLTISVSWPLHALAFKRVSGEGSLGNGDADAERVSSGISGIFDVFSRKSKASKYKHGLDIAFVVLFRHGEKPESGEGLSDVGKERSKYIATCFSQEYSSLVLPFGSPNAVLACTDTKSSHRPRSTVEPLAKALELKVDQSIHKDDHPGFAKHVQKLLRPESSLVVAWHHGSIPALVQELLGPKHWHKDWPTAWPEDCSHPDWIEPKHLRGDSSCYDLVWRVTMKRETGSDKPWSVLGITSTSQGFTGSAHHPCSWGTEALVDLPAVSI